MKDQPSKSAQGIVERLLDDDAQVEPMFSCTAEWCKGREPNVLPLSHFRDVFSGERDGLSRKDHDEEAGKCQGR